MYYIMNLSCIHFNLQGGGWGSWGIRPPVTGKFMIRVRVRVRLGSV